MTPLEKLIFLTDEMMDAPERPLIIGDEEYKAQSTYEERREQARENQKFIESVESLLSQCRWDEALEVLNDDLYTLIHRTEEYI